MALSKEQQQIVAHDPKHHARVLAGPGTGKSFTSVKFLEELNAKYPELAVRYITFTRAATEEFTQKLRANEHLSASSVRPQTVHAFALTLLLKHQTQRIPYPLRIPDSWEQKHLICPDISRMLMAKGFEKVTRKVVNDLKDEMAAGFMSLDPEITLLSEVNPELRNAFLGVWKEHRLRLGYVLLSELTFQAAEVVRENDQTELDIDLIIVDEYQDLNKADISFLKNLAERGVSIIAIGDDDQSIYRWRMAAPDGIRNFLSEYASACDYSLTDCRRCGDNALSAAQTLIETETSRPKKMRLTNSSGKQTAVNYLRFSDEQEEAKGVADLVKKYLDRGVEADKIAILARSSLSDWHKELAPHFEKLQVSLKTSSFVEEALEDNGLRMRLALAKLLWNPDDSLAWRTVLELTNRVGPRLIDFVYSSCGDRSFGQTLLDLVDSDDDIAVSGRVQAWDAVRNALATIDSEQQKLQEQDINFAAFVKNLPGPDIGDEASALFDLHIKQNEAKSLGTFLQTFETAGKDLAAARESGVRLITTAQSKGITVDVAILVGVENGIVPHPSGDRREELRLLYVGMTRAEIATILTWASRRQGPTARHGKSNVGSQRAACDFLDGVLRWEDGARFVNQL